MRTSSFRLILLCLCACTGAVNTARAAPVQLAIVGTNDLHGRVERTAALSGYVSALRVEQKKAKGAVVLVDAGDMFQGTLESNLFEGNPVVRAYNALGYDAVAVGNHEFDFGPVGPAASPQGDSDDPRGALKARAHEARFPFLAANLIDTASGKPVAWPNVMPSTLVKRAGITIGILGVTTSDTAKTTNALNFKGLKTAPLAKTITDEALALRAKGAQVVIVLAHAGGKCSKATGSDDLSSCEGDEEIFRVARELAPRTVDAIVAGHTHQQVAHVVNGIPIVEAWANGRGFGRIDLSVDAKSGATTLVKVWAPQDVCTEDKASIAACTTVDYAGGHPQIDTALLASLKKELDAAQTARSRPLGVVVEKTVRRGYDDESALGNLFADLMLEASSALPGGRGDVAVMNGGGIRADLPEGPLTYGAVYEMMPFDNRFAVLTMTGAELRKMLESNLGPRKKGGVMSLSGVTVEVTCTQSKASVSLVRAGKPVADGEKLRVITTDFLATGGDSALAEAMAEDPANAIDGGDPVREALVRVLAARKGTLRGDDPALFARDKRRIHVAGSNSTRCPGSKQ